jgi:RHS repeat-associated protein
MMNQTIIRRYCFLRLMLAIVVTPFWINQAAGQSALDATTPPGQSPGTPAGSYALSGFDNVNLFNGHLNFRLPLLQVNGRGGVSFGSALPIEQRWTVDHDSAGPYHFPNYNWWTGLRPGYGPGILQGRQMSEGCPEAPGLTQGTTRLTFTAADGTEYELRDQIYGGQAASSNCNPLNPQAPGTSRGTTFVTADGSAATFISDTTINDKTYTPSGPYIVTPSGYVMLRDGTRFRIDNGIVTWMRDRNGNKISFTYTGSYMDQRITSATDSLNRQITYQYNFSDPTYGVCDRIIFKGFGGTQRIIRIVRTTLANALIPGESITTYHNLFPTLHGSSSTNHNPEVVSVVWLPDGRSYQLRYNRYGELCRVDLPTGGRFEYSWTQFSQGMGFQPEINRRVTERRTYTESGSLASRSTYGGYESDGFGTQGTVQADHLGFNGGLLSREKHYFHGHPFSYTTAGQFDLSNPIEGREFKTEFINTNGTTVLRRIDNTWTTCGTLAGTNINPCVSQTVTTLEPATANLVSKQTFAYDTYANQTDVYEYGFSTGSAGSLVRRTHTEYLTTHPVTGTNYATTSSIHLRSLPKLIQILDAGGVQRARAEYEYDNYTTDANHAGLVNRTNISGLESSFTTSYLARGNPTATTLSLINTLGTVTGTISSYQQYDIAGNAVKAIDGRGNATAYDFADRFGIPDANAQGNSGATELGSQVSYAFATKVTNPLAHIVYTQFDYYLGRPVDTEDANAFVSSLYYNDAFDRVTQIRRAVGAGASNQTTFTYDDDDRSITTTSDLHGFGDNVLTGKMFYDGLGRTTETRQYEGGLNYVVIQTQYDALNRPFKSSNPFRPWQSQAAVWTTQTFDALGRVISVTTPDNAAVSTVYSGNNVTVTDQAGKARKSVTDALGRLREVYEDPNGLNYLTSYTYDVLDNLVKVTQGTQQRFFMYDSLKRLIRVRNPEQGTHATLNLSDPLTINSAWSIGYQYDANNNLTQKTDARGVVSTYVYDAINRNTTVDYSDTAAINPDVKRFYDGAANGKGRFWYHYTGGDYATGSNVEHTSIDSYDALGRPTVQRQMFKLNGTWSLPYQTSRTYNRAGSVATQTYPSGHAVTYNYDPAGRLADKDAVNLAFTGNLGDGTTRTYASGNAYNQWGSLSIEKFGTQTALYHKLEYNIRGQLWDVRVGTDASGSWNRGALQFFYDGTYGYGTSGPDNNGNVRKSKQYIPLDESSSTWAIHEQVYNYDALNRLGSVAEYFVSSTHPETQQSLQSYTYDRWGNRTINPASWGTGINVKQFVVDTATNRLGVPGGQSGTMTFDNAGNLLMDTYTGAGTRTYDAENRMTSAVDNTGQTSRYTYDADGQRTRRQIAGSQEQWQIYGFDGELLAEYRATLPASSPEKEYGYRNGQLLVTATGRFNVALAANGAVATASSTHTCCSFSTTGAINGNNRGPWGNGEGWNDATESQMPDWIQVAFAGSKSIDEISVFGLHDNFTQENTPTETQTFTCCGLVAFDVQYWNGSSWVTVPGGSVTGNNKVWRKFTFSPITTSKIRVWINTVPDSWSRVIEIQAFGTSAGGERVQWLVPDHLGTPRLILDETGSRANVKRHDYLPFGEELFAGTGGRTAALGYTANGVRQQFTSKERDIETALDYFGARYFANAQGRFSSVDPLFGSGRTNLPQSWNRYSYVLNNPLRLVDPNGMEDLDPQQIVEIGKDKVINTKLEEIRSKAKPLATGVTPVPTDAVIIPGEQTKLNNATIVGPDGEPGPSGITGYMQPIALVVLDQGGNIIKAPDDMFVVENAQPADNDGKQIAASGGQITTNQIEKGQASNGAFYDLQLRVPGSQPKDVRTTQDVTVRKYFGPKTTDYKDIFQVSGNTIRFDDRKRSITYKPGTVKKL